MIRHAQFYFAFFALGMMSTPIVAQSLRSLPAEKPAAATDAPGTPAFDPASPAGDNGSNDAPIFDSTPPADSLPAPEYASESAPNTPAQLGPPSFLARPNPAIRGSSATAPRTVNIQYTMRRPETVKFRTPDGKSAEAVRYVFETQSTSIDVTEDLNKLDLPPEGKRIAVLTVTAARHQGLLDKLKAAKTPEEKEAATLAVKENYTEHYAIETWWRKQKLAELETRLQELRAQVTQRQESEEKYVTAAMTIAELWADGIGITPPTPSHVPVGATAVQPLQNGRSTYYGVPQAKGPTFRYAPGSEPPQPLPPSNPNLNR